MILCSRSVPWPWFPDRLLQTYAAVAWCALQVRRSKAGWWPLAASAVFLGERGAFVMSGCLFAPTTEIRWLLADRPTPADPGWLAASALAVVASVFALAALGLSRGRDAAPGIAAASVFVAAEVLRYADFRHAYVADVTALAPSPSGSSSAPRPWARRDQAFRM